MKIIKYSQIIFVILLLLLFFSLTSIKAQVVENVFSTIDISKKISPQDKNNSVIDNKIVEMNNKIEVLSKDSKLTSRIETLINILSMFSTVFLGMIGIIGGFLVWNGFLFRQEAKENVNEIKQFKESASQLFESQKDIFDRYQSAVNLTLANADRTIKALTMILDQAGKDSSEIKKLKVEAKNSASEYVKSKNIFSQISAGTESAFSASASLSKSPLRSKFSELIASGKEEIEKRKAMEDRYKKLLEEIKK